MVALTSDVAKLHQAIDAALNALRNARDGVRPGGYPFSESSFDFSIQMVEDLCQIQTEETSDNG